MHSVMKNDLSTATFYDKYARWLEDEGRFETFEEAVDRSIQHARYVVGDLLNEEEYSDLRKGMLSGDAFPSMRWFQMAGEEARRHPQSIFNCSYVAIHSIDAITEALFLLGLGVGVGYSVESKHVSNLPYIEKDFDKGDWLIVVQDSLEGWRDAFRIALSKLYGGYTIKLDISKVRPAGAPLKTRGGIASGPEPFVAAVAAVQDIFISATGRQLRPIEVHDVMCFVASAIVSGGVRRSAMIALFDENDKEMLTCKSFENIKGNKQRYYANNSVVLGADGFAPDLMAIRRTLNQIFENENGEPGIFNRHSANYTSPSRRSSSFVDYGTNPCGEVFLRDMQFCNLSIVNVRSDDTLNSLLKKVRLASIWGTIQASVTDFPGLRQQWMFNQKNERLLGVDLNGVMDNAMFWPGADFAEIILIALKTHAININKLYAAKFGIKEAAAVTCDKPAGNSATFFNTASGIGTRFSKKYIRRVTLSLSSSLAQFLMLKGVKCEPTDGLDWISANTAVFEFYVDASGSLTNEDVTTKEMLEHWLKMKSFWTEHNPSATIYYKEQDHQLIHKFFQENLNMISGITFLPKFENIYAQAPYQKLTDEEYQEKMKLFPKIDWDEYLNFDQFYRAQVGQEYACVSGACEF